jgi:phosphoglycolate phosphatase
VSGAIRLILFDVDGTLVDSQNHIVAAMESACLAIGIAAPSRAEILGIVGLSLPEAVWKLMPEAPAKLRERMVEEYKAGFVRQREELGHAAASPLYSGALDALNALHAVNENILGVATGKSRRGLDSILEAYDLQRMFVTQQVADDHPSKPNPSMIRRALQETGVEPENAVMIGDTSFDMQMARSAGVHGIGVSWGYHPVADLTEAGANVILNDFDALIPHLNETWSEK